LEYRTPCERGQLTHDDDDFLFVWELLRLRVSEFVVWMLWDFLPPVWERATIFALFLAALPNAGKETFSGGLMILMIFVSISSKAKRLNGWFDFNEFMQRVLCS
jgi:hypothetical protein